MMINRRIAIVVPFWNLSETRYKALQICWANLENLKKSFDKSKFDSELDIFNFNLSSTKENEANGLRIDSTIDLVVDKVSTSFDKSIRINEMIMYIKNLGYDFVMMMDSDILIDRNSYSKLFKIFNTSNVNELYKFNMVRTSEKIYKEFDKNGLFLHDSYKDSKDICLCLNSENKKTRYITGIDGDIFFNIDRFIKAGGYNENFKVWGFEDCEFVKRFKSDIDNKVRNSMITIAHLWHVTHTSTAPVEENEYAKLQVRYFRNVEKFMKKNKGSKIIYSAFNSDIVPTIEFKHSISNSRYKISSYLSLNI
ncbi:gp169 [Sphingomonas phage PAU]|uniref:gp169 n=1 Tax=Sphingomonas phage PAU TaxID=1150991 RepID=UPI00025732F5|nr:gp169 [Sphingomonas phage PAU]AFF28167.1 gp169 [Sphingomonas phage PAU]